MHKDMEFQLVEEWKRLTRARKDLERKESELARKTRDQFADGDRGDEQFIAWLKLKLELTQHQAEELLLRATAIKIVPDEATWRRVGGLREIRAVASLPKRERVEVLEIAKSTGRAIRTIVKERHPPVPKIELKPAPIIPIKRTPEPIADVTLTGIEAAVLVKFIRSLRGVPVNVLKVVERLARSKRAAA